MEATPAVAAEVTNEFAATGAAPIAPEPEQTLATPAAIVTPTIRSDDAAGASATVDAPPAPPTITPSTEPKLIRMVQPEYPQEALIRGMEGWVDVSLQVSASGDVIEPRIEATSRGRMFNRAALAAVQQWKYAPRGGDVTAERIVVRLKFQQSN
jgi:protein TonB